MLLPDEQNVLRWLSQYGPLTKQQILGLLRYRPNDIPGRIFRNLRRGKRLVPILDGLYFGTDALAEVDRKMVIAVWVLLQFINNVAPNAHFPAEAPAQIYFVKESACYEILVLEHGESHLTRLLRPGEDQKYIIVLPDIDMAEGLVLPPVPCLYATVTGDMTKEPTIIFYSREESNGDL